MCSTAAVLLTALLQFESRRVSKASKVGIGAEFSAVIKRAKSSSLRKSLNAGELKSNDEEDRDAHLEDERLARFVLAELRTHYYYTATLTLRHY